MPWKRSISVLLLAVTVACRGADDPDGMPATAWTLQDYVPHTDDGIRILIIHDMEGLSGQSDPSSFDFGTDL